MNAVLPEYQSLAEATQKRMDMIQHLKERTESVARSSNETVDLTNGEALVLLHFAEPNIQTTPA